MLDALWPMFSNVLIFVALAVPGYLFVKFGILKSEHTGVLSKILTYLGMPFLILSGVLGVDLDGDFLKNIGILAALTVVYIFALVFLSHPLCKKAGDTKAQGMMRFCAIFANNGFLGLPLAEAVFKDMPVVVTYLVVINILNNIFMYTVGIYLISGDKSLMRPKKALLNPVVIAFALGLVLNVIFANVSYDFSWVKGYSDNFKGIVTPLSMTILGMKLGGIKITSLFTSLKMYYVSALKLVIVPVLGIALFYLAAYLFNMGTAVVLAVFVGFATPTAALSSTFSDEYDGDTEHAVIYTLGTTVLSILTIPLLYGILLLCI